jgi:ketosteroid isomerase-like protein
MTTMPQTQNRTIADQEVLALERSYWDALKDRDTRTIGRLTAEDSTVAGASGVSGVDPRSIAKMIESASYTIKDYRIDPQTMRINRLCDDVVAISYAVHEDLMVDGKPVGLDAFDTSVWKKTHNGWTCVVHTESIKGDAFGRDRLHRASAS